MGSANTKHKKFSVSRFFIYLILVIWAFTTIFPFIWVVNSSFKTSSQILNQSFSIAFPPIWDNFINAFENQNILRSYVNSLIISGLTTLFVVLLGAMAAYAMVRYHFRGKAVLQALITVGLMFPAFSTIIPVFRMMAKLNLIDTPWSVILPQTAGSLSFAIIIMMGFMRSLPHQLEESAYIEGCNIMQIFIHIVLPLSRPVLSTAAIFTFLWSYNDLFTQFIMIRDREKFPVSALLNEISSKYGTDFGLMAASVTLIVIPIFIVYLLLQKNIVKGLTAGAVKG